MKVVLDSDICNRGIIVGSFEEEEYLLEIGYDATATPTDDVDDYSGDPEEAAIGVEQAPLLESQTNSSDADDISDDTDNNIDTSLGHIGVLTKHRKKFESALEAIRQGKRDLQEDEAPSGDWAEYTGGNIQAVSLYSLNCLQSMNTIFN